MFIRDLQWDAENEEHIAEHNVDPDEVEDVCFGRCRIERVSRDKHAVLGQTAEGRYLFIVVAHKGGGLFRPITAREMNDAERRRYAKWK
jgi:uncharacterized DUF497 family protein